MKFHESLWKVWLRFDFTPNSIHNDRTLKDLLPKVINGLNKWWKSWDSTYSLFLRMSMEWFRTSIWSTYISSEYVSYICHSPTQQMTSSSQQGSRQILLDMIEGKRAILPHTVFSSNKHQVETQLMMTPFSALLAICAGNSPVSAEGQWRGAFMFYLICAWINGCVNNREPVIWNAMAPIVTSL